MQRIACLASCGLLGLLLVGCSSSDSREVRPRPLPDPLLAIRPPPAPPPRVVQPPPTKPRATQPPPAPAISRAGWVPSGGVKRGKWRTIVVHHSASGNSSPQGMHQWHLQRGWENGLGYHFVIGNGVNFGDGEVYVGPRWRRQQTGAHCKSSSGTFFGIFRPSNFFNERGIGICLVGNFQNARATPSQLESLKQLTRFLCNEAGIGAGQIYGHGEVTGATECPGRNLNMSVVRRNAGASVAANTDWLQRLPLVAELGEHAAIVYRALQQPALTAKRLLEPMDAADARARHTLRHLIGFEHADLCATCHLHDVDADGLDLIIQLCSAGANRN